MPTRFPVGLLVGLGLLGLGGPLENLTVGVAQGESGELPAGSSKSTEHAGHSKHGEVFNEGPRQKAYLMPGTGKVHLPVTTRSLRVQQFFDQGVGQLHGFWYFEAERSFRQAAALDPQCAMAYWGMAMANIANEKRARGFLEEAVKRKKYASRREHLWIDGLAEYLTDKKIKSRQKRQNYVQALERLVKEYPDELEAKAFLSVRLWQFRRDLPKSSHARADALHKEIFRLHPSHPAHHYRIHLWDHVKPARALGSASMCGQTAPSIAHMWHMPGHIYSRLHRYADAVWQQEASSRADHAHMIRDRVLPDQIHNYAHNQEWLIRNLIHIGRVRHALDLARNLIELPRHPRYNTLRKRGRSASYGRARLLLVLERYELWDKTLDLADTMFLEPTDIPDEQVKRLRLLGLAHAGKKNRDQLGKIIQELDARLAARKNKGTKTAAKPKANRPNRRQNRSLEYAINELKGLDRLLAGKSPERSDAGEGPGARYERRGPSRAERSESFKEAVRLFKKVRGLNKARLARYRMEAGDQAYALVLASQAANAAPGQVLPLANHVELLHRAGKKTEAREQFAKLRKMSGQVDSLEYPPFRRLAPVARDLKLPEDWRLPAKTARDIGKRPPLREIGPLRWRPSPAPDWSLPDADGKTISLRSYRGKPVIVIFYLGHGCLHCVEQLNTFAPKTRAFTDAGIELVAISSDSLEDLKKSQDAFKGTLLERGDTADRPQNKPGKLDERRERRPAPSGGRLAPHGGTTDRPKKEGFPFPLVSDSTLKTFKAYRVFDDFEDLPLHGTFLVDGQGLVRWQDISYEPFNDVDFLLTEAKRLLALPVSSATRPAGEK